MSTDAPTWYDLLGVAPDASADEVRAAWRSALADLDPGDRRFDPFNRAAKVLLDPAARQAYDESLVVEGLVTGLRPSSTSGGSAGAAESPLVEEGALESPLVEEGALAPVTRPARRGLVTRLRRSSTSGGSAGGSSASGSPTVPGWLLVGLGVLAAALVAASVWAWSRDPGGSTDEAWEAQLAAERAVVPVLSYDHRDLERSAQAARAQLTGAYRQDYDRLFAVIEENAPRTGTTVTAEVVASGIVRSGDGRVQVLLFVDRPTTNKQTTTPVVYRDQVTLSMQEVEGEWLVDDMVTSPPAQ